MFNLNTYTCTCACPPNLCKVDNPPKKNTLSFTLRGQYLGLQLLNNLDKATYYTSSFREWTLLSRVRGILPEFSKRCGV